MMDSKSKFRFSVFFAVVYFFSINGIAAFPNFSISFLLKEVVHLTPSQASYFLAVTSISWVVKPLWGYISDTRLFFGTRRKSYLVATSLVAGAAWLALGLMNSFPVGWLLFWITLAYMAYAFQDVVTDGLMVELGQPENMTGKFQSIQWSAVYLALIITSLAGGYIADQTRSGRWSYQSIFLASAIFPLLTAWVTLRTVQESKKEKLERTADYFKSAFKNKSVWLLSLFLFLWTFSPSIGTPFFYYAVDKLKFSGSFLGMAQAIASVTALITSLLIGKWLDRIPLRKTLVIAIFAGVAVILFHLIYFYPPFVAQPKILKMITLVTRVPFAFFDTLVFLMLANLAAKAAPPDVGGSIFALFMSFYNLGQVGSAILGGLLLAMLGLPMLMVISALFSLLALFVLPYLAIAEELTLPERWIVGFFSKAKQA